MAKRLPQKEKAGAGSRAPNSVLYGVNYNMGYGKVKGNWGGGFSLHIKLSTQLTLPLREDRIKNRFKEAL